MNRDLSIFKRTYLSIRLLWSYYIMKVDCVLYVLDSASLAWLDECTSVVLIEDRTERHLRL
jgi:hypothetical protein